MSASIQLIPKIHTLVLSLQRHHPLQVFLPLLNLQYVVYTSALGLIFPSTYSSIPTASVNIYVLMTQIYLFTELQTHTPISYWVSISPQVLHRHLKLRVPQNESGIYSLPEPKSIFSHVLFILVKHLLSCPSLKTVYHPGNISLLSSIFNQSSSSDVFTSYLTNLFISIYSHCHCPNLGHHHFSTELF